MTRDEKPWWFVSGPNAHRFVNEWVMIEPVVAELAALSGDDPDDYTATRVDEEDVPPDYGTKV